MDYICVNGERYMIGGKYEFTDNPDCRWQIAVLMGYVSDADFPWITDSQISEEGAYMHIRKARPKRPEIAIDEPVFDHLGSPRHFAGWTPDGRPTFFLQGRTSHTATGLYHGKSIKTQSGQVWPPEDEVTEIK